MLQTTAYGQLAAQLREEIARGDYAGGRRLPTEVELAATHGLGRQTVRRALQELVNEGLVFRVRGRGTFTTTLSPTAHHFRSIGSIAEIVALSLETVRETLQPLQTKADVGIASRLQLDSDQIMTASFRRFHEQTPFSMIEIFLPPAIGRKLQAHKEFTTPGETARHSVVSVVDELVPDGIAGAHQSVTAVALSESLVVLLDRPQGTPTLRIDRLFFNRHGRPVLLSISHFDPGRYTYRVQLWRGGTTH
jgi:GntR family transcriptional regulator